MFHRFTDGARRIMGLSRAQAERLGHDFIDAEHIMLALIEEGSALPDDPDRYKLEVLMRRPPVNSMVTMGTIPLTVRAKNALEGALEHISSLKKTELGCEDLLQGVLKVWDIEPDAFPR